MPKRIMPLASSAVASAKPQAAPYVLRDGFGLLLRVDPAGGKRWLLDYRRPGTGKRNTLSLGNYPDVSLKQARDRRTDAQRLLERGVDPGAQHTPAPAAGGGTFEAVAREWYAARAPGWADSHGSRIIRRLERDVFPWLGGVPICDLTAPGVLTVLRRIEGRGSGETAHRALSNVSQVLRYAVASGLAPVDVTAGLSGALKPVNEGHMAAPITPADVGALLRDVWACPGSLQVVTALRLSPYLFVRPGELRRAEWPEFDLDHGVWQVPAARRKLKKKTKENPLTGPHIVPLARQAVALLRDLQPLTGIGRFVFPGTRDPHKPLSDAALLAAMRRQGHASGTVTMHGWRATARTILAERLHYPVAIIEHRLDHAVRDPLGTAYNRTSFLPERTAMMQAWADYLDKLRNEG